MKNLPKDNYNADGYDENYSSTISNIKTTDINILLNRVKVNNKKENKKKVVLLLIIASILGAISFTTIF
tara:strand:+ start:630 stop:836 length:207 start_codon:yes stop_codon:yes gene_type:complete